MAEEVGYRWHGSAGPYRGRRLVAGFKRRIASWAPRLLVAVGALWLAAVVFGQFVKRGDIWMYPAESTLVGRSGSLKQVVWLMNPTRTSTRFKVRPACGCTSVKPSEAALDSLSASAVTVEFETASMPSGEFRKDLFLECTRGAKQWTEMVPITISIPRRDQLGGG